MVSIRNRISNSASNLRCRVFHTRMGSLSSILMFACPFSSWEFSHQTAPIAIASAWQFAAEHLPEARLSLAGVPGVDGCHRQGLAIEPNCIFPVHSLSRGAASEWLHDWHKNWHPDSSRSTSIKLEQSACLFHLIKVVSGADSMIIGEPQLPVGQAGLAHGRRIDALDTRWTAWFQHAFAPVPSEFEPKTDIGRDPVTLPFAALRLARQIFGPLDTKRAL